MLSLLALLQTPPQQKFPPINWPGSFADLRGAVEHACGITGSADVKTMLDRELKAATDVRGSNVPADKWLTLGCARADLAGERALSRSGPLMVPRNSWAQGAERAMQEVLKQRPGDARAAEVLGLLALDDNDPDDLKSAATSLTRAMERGVTAPGVLRACAELSSRTHADSALRTCSQRALRAGFDSTWHLMRLAQLAFRSCDTITGNKEFILAASVARDSLARQEVNWHLQWFLSPEEREAWTRVADTARASWLRDKTISRDVRDGQPFGARVAEHFSRLDYVEENFRLQVNRRTREALRTGPNMDESANQDNDDKIRSTCEPGMVLVTEWRFYPRWQTDFDDRGVVWMRFGPPEKRIRSEPSCRVGGAPHNTRELWMYEIDGERLLLNFEYEAFSGSVEATRLVEGVLGSYLCDVDAYRCRLNELSFAHSQVHNAQSDFVHPEDIVKLHESDREYISAATTKDDNSPRGDRPLALVSRLHRLWDPPSGASIALVTYALPAKELSIQEHAGEGTTVVDLELRQWDPNGDRWSDTAFSRHFAVPDTNLKRPNVVGFAVVPSTPGVSSWSLVATQPDHRRGRFYDVSSPGLVDARVSLSDIVLGSETQGLTWNLHNVPIPLAPVNAVDRRAAVALYYQIRSDVARPDLRATVAVYRVKDGVATDTAALQVSFAQAVRSGINEVAPVLDVSRLDKGSYRLDVTLADAHGTTVARRSVALELE